MRVKQNKTIAIIIATLNKHNLETNLDLSNISSSFFSYLLIRLLNSDFYFFI